MTVRNNITTNEEWKPIPNYPGYEASNFGRIRSWRHKSGLKKSPIILKPFTFKSAKYPNKPRYQLVSLYDRNSQNWPRKFAVHYLVVLTFIGKRPRKNDVRHLDGNPSNNHLDNLAYGTRKENNADAGRHGTRPAGQRHGMSKLTEEQAKEVIRRGKAGDRVCEIARDLPVTSVMVGYILAGKNWKHLPR